MKISFKKDSQSAQQTLEYSLILALVAAGIIVMGPYVIRSWNANLKGAEDSVIDSFQDPLLEDPTPIDLPGCTDRGLFWDGCGGSYKSIKCEDYLRAKIRQCDPDPTCCEEAGLEMILCLPSPGGYPECCTGWEDMVPLICAGDAAPYLPDGCPNGEKLQQRRCSRNGAEYYQHQCVPDSDCNVACDRSALPPPGSFEFCQDAQISGNKVDPEDETHLPCTGAPCDPVAYNFIEYDPNSPTLGCTRAKCEIICCPGWCAEN